MSKEREILLSLEWAGSVKGAPWDTRMGGSSDGPTCRACPICKGIHPADFDRGGFTRLGGPNIGHTPDCYFAKQ